MTKSPVNLPFVQRLERIEVTPHDDLPFRIGSNAQMIIIDFGKPVQTVHIQNPEQAEAMAQILMKHAQNLRRKQN